MIADWVKKLASALGCREDQAEDVLTSEASARATLSRRALLGAGAAAVGAVAAGNLFSVGGIELLDPFQERIARGGSLLTTFDALLKERYMDTSLIDKLVYGKNPLFGMIGLLPEVQNG